MNIDILDQIRKARNDVMSSAEGNTGTVGLSVAQVDALLNALAEQEVELAKAEEAHESFRHEVQVLVESLSCNDFSKETPSKEDDGQVFEVFQGESLTNCGRAFANWDLEGECFYQVVQGEDGEDEYYGLNDVLCWRACLPEPHEMIEVPGLE